MKQDTNLSQNVVNKDKNEKIVLLNFRGHIMKMTETEFKEFQERLKEWDNWNNVYE